jgi:hypothetical protein
MGSPISGTIAEIFLRHLENTLNTHYSNTIHSSMRLTPTTETDHSISFLDLHITRNRPNLEINMFRKPTTTDTTINFYSNHPLEHKMAVYRYHIERMYTLPITD